jgi:hypothetical protein
MTGSKCIPRESTRTSERIWSPSRDNDPYNNVIVIFISLRFSTSVLVSKAEKPLLDFWSIYCTTVQVWRMIPVNKSSNVLNVIIPRLPMFHIRLSRSVFESSQGRIPSNSGFCQWMAAILRPSCGSFPVQPVPRPFAMMEWEL